MTKMEPCNELVESFEINKKWLNGETEKVLQNSKTRGMPQANFSTWPVMKKIQYKEKNYRIMAQIANGLHVKNHALWDSDYAIKLINKMYPNNFDEVKKEREIQTALMKSV